MNEAIFHRAFFALQPSQNAGAAIYRQSLLCGAGRRVRPEHLHLTLAITEDYAAPPQTVIDRIIRLAEELWLAPFELKLDWLTGSEHSLALCPTRKPPELLLLQLQLQKALALSGIRRPGWRFSPHVTLLYRNGAPFSRLIAPISWWVSELVLIHSHVGLTRHDIVGRWPLLPRSSAPMAA